MFIEIEDIKKTYGSGENSYYALKGISFKVDRKEAVGWKIS